MVGQDVRAGFVLYLREDRLQFFLVLQPISERVRLEQFIRALRQVVSCPSPNEISRCAKVLVITDNQPHSVGLPRNWRRASPHNGSGGKNQSQRAEASPSNAETSTWSARRSNSK